jgi:hypothetical protein
LVRSATGRLVKRGDVHSAEARCVFDSKFEYFRAPEIKYEEIQWGAKIGGIIFVFGLISRWLLRFSVQGNL